MAAAVQSSGMDEGHCNWMTSALSLNVVRDVLGPEIKREIDAVHSTLQKIPPVCGKCKTKDMKFNKPKKLWEIKCGKCQPWVTEVSKLHASRTDANVYKENSDMSKWPSDSWEIAKFYMPKGQSSQNTGPESSDCAGLLSLMCNCTLFDKKNNTPLQKLLTVRNKTFHCANMTLDKQTMETNINKMIDVLQQIFPNSTQQAVRELEKMRDGPLSLSGEKFLAAEIEAIKTRLTELIQKVEESTTGTEATEDHQSEDALVATIEFVLKNDDRLREELQTKIDEGTSLFRKMKEDVEAVGSRMDEGEKRLSNVENRFEELEFLCTKFSRLPKAGAAVDYKGQLQNYTQKNQLDKPVYSPFPHIDGGYVSEVKVDGKTYATDEPTVKSVDAEKEAAKIALITLGLLRGGQLPRKVGEVQARSGGPAVGKVPAGSVGPAQFTDGMASGARPKQAIPGQALTNNKTTPDVLNQPSEQSHVECSDSTCIAIKKSHLGVDYEVSCQRAGNKWTATAMFSATGAVQLPIQENRTTKKDSKQAVAQRVLDKLEISVTKGSSAVEKLHTYCGENKKTFPDYVDGGKNSDGTFGCIMIWQELKCTEVISLLGDACPSQEDARKTAIMKAEEMIKRLPVQNPSHLKTDAINSRSEKMLPTEQKPSASLETVKGRDERAAAENITKPQNTVDTITNEVSGISLSCKANKSPKVLPTATLKRNYVSVLNEKLQKSKEFEKISEDSQPENGKFKHLLKMKANSFKQFPEEGHPSNKVADKHLALYVLRKLYPDKVPDISLAKNRLQEESVKVSKDNVPRYTNVVVTQGSDHRSSCGLMFEVVSELFPDKMSAKQNAYKRVLDIIDPN